jgi:DNA polymerase-3 subunit alpha
MVKVITRKNLGVQNVYDIGVKKDHNFIIKNGLIASNCFNKSHSTAYAYVTYQTAYLKANYQLEYMAALLTANSGDTEKVQKYLVACVKMKIDIESPDINRSGINFTPSAKKILFGLSGVRNVGLNAINSILEAREKGDDFKSLADFCDRVDLRSVNRRALEALINCGAFDKLNNNRQQLIKDLELVYDWAQSRARDRAVGQGNIFDIIGGGDFGSSPQQSSFDSAPKAKPVDDFPPQEKLRLEKELLGFYVSDHPLKSISKSAGILSPISLYSIPEQKVGAFVCVIVMLNQVKKVMTKKGDAMAILQIEDINMTTEVVAFPKVYERISAILEVDKRIIIWGKIEKKEEQKQLIVEEAESVDTVQLVTVELNPQQANDIEHNDRLRNLLREYSGEKEKGRVPVVGIVQSGNNRKFVRFGRQFWVHNARQTVQALNNYRFISHLKLLNDE